MNMNNEQHLPNVEASYLILAGKLRGWKRGSLSVGNIAIFAPEVTGVGFHVGDLFRCAIGDAVFTLSVQRVMPARAASEIRYPIRGGRYGKTYRVKRVEALPEAIVVRIEAVQAPARGS